MAISLLEMGRIKKRSVRETIISILSREFPLNIKKIYNKIKKGYNLEVTYQAVFKIIKEMIEDNILEKKDREYKLNLGWIKQLENELGIIKNNYLEKPDEPKKQEMRERLNAFVSQLGPKIKEYIGKDEATIIGLDTGGGRLFATALSRYLLREGLMVVYCEIEEAKQAYQEKLMIPKNYLENKKVIVVDSAIYSGKTYNMVMGKLNQNKNKMKIKDIKYVVDKDLIGLADFARI